MHYLKIFLQILICTAILVSCKKTDTTPNPTPTPPPTTNPCIGVVTTVNADAENTITNQSVGTITIKSPIGSAITYNINGGAYQGSTNFFNLPAGNYTVGTKTAAGCVGSTSISIASYGPKYYAVKALVKGNCGPCHLNGGNSGAKNFDTDNSILTSWARIKARAVDNLPSVMPQSGPLTNPDKQKITDWVNAGHLITD